MTNTKPAWEERELKLWDYLVKKVDSKTAKEIWHKVTNLYKNEKEV